MNTFAINIQTLANISHRINKVTSTILSAPTKGYSGACPFLRGLSSIGGGGGGSSNTNTDYPDGSLYSRSLFVDAYDTPHYQTQCSSVIGQVRVQDEQPDYETSAEQQEESQSNESDYAQHQEPRKYHHYQHQQQQKQNEEKHKQEFKSYDYNSRLKELIRKKKDDETYRVFRKVRRFSQSFPHGLEQGRPVTIWCSNDYFGMSSHPKVCEAIEMALKEYGAGSGGTRNIAGNSPVHEQLEWELADLHNKEAALLFSSCYVANDSTLFTLLKLIPDCHIVSDAGNHASMIQGIRNSGAKKHIFKSFDPVDLEEKLKEIPLTTPKIVAFETVHSMDGDISQVEKMCDIAHNYGAITFVDEVHAVGLYGERGAGIGQRDGCMDKIDIVSGTLGKAYGNCGGYVAGSSHLIDVVRSYASGFIFTTSLPPTVACGAIESVRILKGDEGRYLRKLQQDNVIHMKKALTAAGLPHYHSKSHIIPIPVEDAAKCTQVSNDLLEVGHYIQSINYPTVAKGTERLRVSVTPFHTPMMIDSMIEKLISVWRRNNLNFVPPVDMVGECKRHKLLNCEESKSKNDQWCDICHKEMDLCTRVQFVG